MEETAESDPEAEDGPGGRDLEWVRQRVLNVVGHELRTPTASIRGLAETLAGGVDPAAAPELTAALVRNARRLERLLDDLLAASEISASLPSEPPAALAVGPYLLGAWQDAGGAPDQLFGGGETVVCWARPTSVRRILFQVMDNAVKYGSARPTVDVSTSDGRVVVEVDSPGPVLSEEDVRYATEMFWRGERAVTSTWGLGIGLGVASLLACHEGGSLRVRAGRTGGMMTRLELPASLPAGRRE